MRNILAILVLAAIVLPAMAAPIPSGIGILDYAKYTDPVKADIMQDKGAEEILDASVSLFMGDLSMTATIDNATESNVYRTVALCAGKYLNFYTTYGWPDKATVYVNNAGGTQIGTATVYSKWIDELNSAGGVDNQDALLVYAKKVMGTVKVWTWNL